MLPEAESINKDGSQEGLVEAANIPLQSKEEDQMWKILKMDESTIPCMCDSVTEEKDCEKQG